MVHLFFFLSSSLVSIISILLLNPLPIIYSTPINNDFKLSRHNNDGNSLVFEGLLGCKYDSNICNRNEACFDDELFGQCWDGKGSERTAFALKDGINDNKLIALEYTLDFLNHYHLDWKDYMTQCILSHVLNNYHQLNRNHLKSFYHDCLTKDEMLDEYAAIRQRKDTDRRQLGRHNSKHQFNDHNNPYASLARSRNKFSDLDVPLFIEYDRTNDPSRLSNLAQEDRFHQSNTFYVVDDEIPSQDQLIADESIMNEPRKLTIHMNEGHPSLSETLQINNNKQLLPKLSQEAMIRKNLTLNSADAERYFTVETARGYIVINRDFKDQIEAAGLLALIAQIHSWPVALFTELNADHRILTFYVLNNAYQINASSVASSALHNQIYIENQLGIRIIDAGIGNPTRGGQLSAERHHGSRWAIIALVTCAMAIFIMSAFTLLYFIKRNDRIRNKLAEITHIKGLSTNDYQDLCRQRMQTQPTGNKSPEIHTVHQATTASSSNGHDKRNSESSSSSSSSRSSTSSWIEEPIVPINMDIMTGHLILSYMEDHLRDRHRLEGEWQALCTDEANEERSSCSIALAENNINKNRYIDCVPYDHTRIRLINSDDEDYINASTIFDSDPKCKYIATQGPTANTTNAFWQMVWEQGSCVIVALTRPIENGMTMCHHYWPVEGSALFYDFEVNLVSEHIWSDDYVVRSFYLKNIQTMETRTVTQFHFLTWNELTNPPSAKALLDFRRKVNKCYRGRSSPIIVHCNDGVGRTGTFILLDIVLNRIYKGAREINIATTLEHIRDQRAKLVKTKKQFEFVFVAVAEEVTYLLKALPQ